MSWWKQGSTVTLVAAFVVTVVVANVVTDTFGLLPILGFLVPAGSLAAGLALSLRDLLQEGSRTPTPMVVALVLGVVASIAFASPALAIASGVAFFVSELADLAVYTPLRKRGMTLALVVSNVVGAVVDTALFLHLAGFPLTLDVTVGQFIVKAVFATAVVLAVRVCVTRFRREPSCAST